MKIVRARILSTAVAATLVFVGIKKAEASLIIDYQFDPAGTTTKNIGSGDVGSTVTVQVWGTVSIAAGDSGLVGIAAAGFRAQSQLLNSGAFTTQGVGAGGFTPLASFNNVPNKGQTSDVNSDGIRDLGVLSGVLSTLDAKARGTGSPLTPAAPGYYSDQGGWTVTATSAKVELGTFKIVIGTLGAAGATTKFNVGLPQNVSGASWFENVNSADDDTDGIADGEGGTNAFSPISGSYVAGTSVSFVATGGGGGTTVAPVYKYALTTHGNATLGTSHSKTLTVVGSNGNYMDPGPASNFTPADPTTASYAISNASLGVGGEVPILVMVDFNLGASGTTIAALKGLLQSAGDVSATIVGPGDADPLGANARALLLTQYGFTDATTLLFEFLSAPGATANGEAFGFDLTGSGISVTRAIAVPEPASMGLVALGGLGLLSRRRR